MQTDIYKLKKEEEFINDGTKKFETVRNIIFYISIYFFSIIIINIYFILLVFR